MNNPCTFEEYVENESWVIQSMWAHFANGGLNDEELFDSIKDQAQYDYQDISDIDTVDYTAVLNSVYNSIDFKAGTRVLLKK